MKTIIVFSFCIMASCHYTNRVTKSSTYIVKTATTSVNGWQTISFKNYKGKYKILADTLAAGDTIKLNVLKFKN